ncbi:MAG: mechanosensitive ion channel [Thioalkalispiraceae bacterium]|jgi:small-conductance mechanosensitive channel
MIKRITVSEPGDSMDKFNEFISAFWFEVLDLDTRDNWWQVGIILGSLIVAYFISHKLSNYFTASTSAEDIKSLKRITLKTIKRLVFPITALLLILLGKAILHAIQLPAQFLDIAITLLLSLATIRIIFYILRKGFAPSPLLKAWENIISTLIWLMVALYLLDWLPVVMETLQGIGFKLGSNKITLLSIINFILFIALFFTLAIWLSNTIEKRLKSSQNLNASLKVALSKLVKVIFITFAVLIALDTAGIDLTALTVFGGALGVGLGFGLQRIASNFISGFLLLFDKSIKPGDTISIGDKFGWVQELRARYIVVRDRDGVDTLIPNENLITTDVINWSYGDRNVRLKAPISISYHDDPETAMQLMVEAASETNRVLTDPAPVARLMAFGDNGIELECRVWINDPQQGLNNVRSDLNLNMWKKFKQAGITIPFPQRDVYIKQMPG